MMKSLNDPIHSSQIGCNCQVQFCYLSVENLELEERSDLHLQLYSDPLADRHGTANLLNGA